MALFSLEIGKDSEAMVSLLRRLWVCVRPEVAQHDQSLHPACVFEGDAGFSGVLGAEHFIFGQLVKAD